jgi:hypothetical protein
MSVDSNRTKYLAVIGDIRRSREVVERAELQKLIERVLGDVNAEFADCIASGFVITLGDEFQGLLVEPVCAIRVLVALDLALGAEASVRYGLGWGEVTTDLRHVALGMDGPCFHRAREAVAEGKRLNRWATVSGLGRDDELLNGVLWLLGATRERWTRVQRETVSQARFARTQREVAEARGVNESSISQALKAALHEPVLAAERAVEIVLGRHGGGTDGGTGAAEEDE